MVIYAKYMNTGRRNSSRHSASAITQHKSGSLCAVWVQQITGPILSSANCEFLSVHEQQIESFLQPSAEKRHYWYFHQVVLQHILLISPWPLYLRCSKQSAKDHDLFEPLSLVTVFTTYGKKGKCTRINLTLSKFRKIT
jgi:predicted ABC-type exoprotein transport system permease subunit